jgi:hypothetical protein
MLLSVLATPARVLIMAVPTPSKGRVPDWLVYVVIAAGLVAVAWNLVAYLRKRRQK